MGEGGKGSSTSSVSSSSGGAAEAGDGGGDGTMERGAWGGKIEFILTCIGYAVGLGNVWRFPYLTYKNGGGAFLIPFVIMLLIIGIPMFFMELCWGQFASLGPIAIWNMNPLMKGLGVSMVLTNLMVAMYYNVIISWCLYFLFASMTDKLPWESCGNLWNTEYCMETKNFANLTDNVTLSTNETVPKSMLKSPSDEYFYRKVLQLSDDINDSGTVVWQLALCLLLAWIIVFSVLIKGIGSLGKVVYFTSTFPYVLLTIMLIRGVTLDGASYGIEFYLIPDWDKLLDAEVWSNAATQIFYALSTCTGGLLAMASYNQFKNNTLRDSLIVPIVNVLTSFYAGFVIFSVLGYMAKLKGVSVDEVAASGPGLVFVVYPEGLTTMPVAPLWSILFFCMMLMLGLSSMFSMAECFFSGFMDEYPHILRKTYYRTVAFRAVGCTVFYLISLPMICNTGFYIFTIWDKYTGDFPLLFIGVIELVAVMYLYGYKNFAYDVEMMLGKKPNIIFRICWMAVTPIVILAIIIFTAIQYKPPIIFGKDIPVWGEALGWGIVTLCLVFIPVIFLYQFCRNGGAKLLLLLNNPSPAWGPAKPANRTGKYATDKTPLVVETSAWSATADGTEAAVTDTTATIEDDGTKGPPPFYADNHSIGSVKNGGVANAAFAVESDEGNRSATDSGSTGHESNPSSQEMKDGNDDDSEVAAF